VLAEAGAELLEFKLFAARLATQSVVVIAGFLADEEYGFDFLFSFSSSHGGGEGSGFRVRGSVRWAFLDLKVIRNCTWKPVFAPEAFAMRHFPFESQTLV
jgi:hypothetical protein